MLPLLRILPVGGVLLAIVIVLLALNPPGGADSAMPSASAPARGALVSAQEHPEWRHFLIQAAIRRADELDRLLRLPDTPTWMPDVKPDVPVTVQDLPAIPPEPAAKVTSIPAVRSATDPEDVTGSISDTDNATLPVDIGAASSSELPVIPQPETPPVTRTPERSKPQDESHTARKPAKRTARRRAPPAPPPVVEQPTQNIFEQLFGQGRPSTAPAAPPAQPARTGATRPAATTAQR
jgi:hypothetical protein